MRRARQNTTPAAANNGNGPYKGIVTTTASAATDRVDVGLDLFDNATAPWHNCPFTPLGDLLPARGDVAWVMLDQDHAAIIVTWRPNAA